VDHVSPSSLPPQMQQLFTDIGTALSGAADEEVPRVPDSKARQKCLARQYSGDDALPAGCKFP
jgi:hypothetical protein